MEGTLILKRVLSNYSRDGHIRFSLWWFMCEKSLGKRGERFSVETEGSVHENGS